MDLDGRKSFIVHDVLAGAYLCLYTTISALGIPFYITGRFNLGNFILFPWMVLGLFIFIAWFRLPFNLKTMNKKNRLVRLLIFITGLAVIIVGLAHFMVSNRATMVYLQGFERSIREKADVECIRKWAAKVPERGTYIEPPKFPECINRLKPVYVLIGDDGKIYILLGGFPGAVYTVVNNQKGLQLPSDAIPAKGGYIELSKK